MDRRTFLMRGSAALAAAALAAVLPKQAAAVPDAPDASWVRLREGTRPGKGDLTLLQQAIRQNGEGTDAERATVEMFTTDSPVMSFFGGEVKIDRFVMDDYVPQPRTLYPNPPLLARAKAAYGDSFYGIPLAPTDVGYPPQSTMLHWKSRAASGDARLQGTARRRLLRRR
jgi:hypothetical protein